MWAVAMSHPDIANVVRAYRINVLLNSMRKKEYGADTASIRCVFASFVEITGSVGTEKQRCWYRFNLFLCCSVDCLKYFLRWVGD